MSVWGGAPSGHWSLVTNPGPLMVPRIQPGTARGGRARLRDTLLLFLHMGGSGKGSSVLQHV